MKHLVVVLLMIIAHLKVVAQDYAKDMQAIHQHINTTHQLQFSVDVHMQKDQEVLMKRNVHFKKDGTTYFYDLESEIYYYADQISVHVDKKEREISVAEPEKGKTFERAAQNQFDVDQLLKTLAGQKVWQFVEKKGDLATYDVMLASGPISKVRVVVNQDKKFYEELHYTYHADLYGEGVTARLKFYQVADQLTQALSPAQFIKRTRAGTYQPTGKYLGYTLQHIPTSQGLAKN